MKRRSFLQALLAFVGCGVSAQVLARVSVEKQCYDAAEFSRNQVENFLKRKAAGVPLMIRPWDDRVYFWNGEAWWSSNLRRHDFGAMAFREIGPRDA